MGLVPIFFSVIFVAADCGCGAEEDVILLKFAARTAAPCFAIMVDRIGKKR